MLLNYFLPVPAPAEDCFCGQVSLMQEAEQAISACYLNSGMRQIGMGRSFNYYLQDFSEGKPRKWSGFLLMYFQRGDNMIEHRISWDGRVLWGSSSPSHVLLLMLRHLHSDSLQFLFFLPSPMLLSFGFGISFSLVVWNSRGIMSLAKECVETGNAPWPLLPSPVAPAEKGCSPSPCRSHCTEPCSVAWWTIQLPALREHCCRACWAAGWGRVWVNADPVMLCQIEL